MRIRPTVTAISWMEAHVSMHIYIQNELTALMQSTIDKVIWRRCEVLELWHVLACIGLNPAGDNTFYK